MKKILLSTMCCLAVLVMATGCNNNNSEVLNENQNNNFENSENNNQMEDNNEVEFTYAYKVPGKNIYVDVPNWQEIEKGFTQIYILHGERYVAVTADKNNTTTDLTKAHEYSFEKFKQNIQNYSYVNSLNVTKDSKETINGIEVYKYEGTLNCGKDTVYNAYVIGYSFIMDGVPCNVTGSVINQEQPEEMIEEIKAIVEAMIKTVRTER